ncbi:MAG: helix-turn-helix domain-containing protein [Lachnospiraceae bacterium]|nr:helix-turn-helix domain-containing protein [Lachnospiraceae bacterium]
MDQIKIGGFIAELRKEKGLTQKQLAEQIGVSDKAVSKWECGNGLPELSCIPVLCRALGIDMNELLSGERLAGESYSKKVEENMMTLMKETEEQKKKNKNAWTTVLLSLIGVLAAFLVSNAFPLVNGGFSLWVFIDLPTLLMLVIPTVLLLVASGHGKAFLQAFTMLGNKKNYTLEQRKRSRLALKLVSDTVLVLGILTVVFGWIYICYSSSEEGLTMYGILTDTIVAVLGFVYGAAAYLLLLPVRIRLEDAEE